MASTSRTNLSPQMAKGMFGGPRGKKGNYLQGELAQTSGTDGSISRSVQFNQERMTTYGGKGDGWFWKDYPSVIGGMTKYADDATMPGSNMSVVNPDVSQLAKKAGMAPDYFGISN
jgi:hypothetical protein